MQNYRVQNSCLHCRAPSCPVGRLSSPGRDDAKVGWTRTGLVRAPSDYYTTPDGPLFSSFLIPIFTFLSVFSLNLFKYGTGICLIDQYCVPVVDGRPPCPRMRQSRPLSSSPSWTDGRLESVICTGISLVSFFSMIYLLASSAGMIAWSPKTWLFHYTGSALYTLIDCNNLKRPVWPELCTARIIRKQWILSQRRKCEHESGNLQYCKNVYNIIGTRNRCSTQSEPPLWRWVDERGFMFHECA